MKFWFNYNKFLGLAIIEVQMALFKISSTSNTKIYLAWLMLSWRKFNIKVVLHFGKPQNCVNILRKKLLADVVFVWEIKFRNKTTDAGIWLKGGGCALFALFNFFFFFILDEAEKEIEIEAIAIHRLNSSQYDEKQYKEFCFDLYLQLFQMALNFQFNPVFSCIQAFLFLFNPTKIKQLENNLRSKTDYEEMCYDLHSWFKSLLTINSKYQCK